MKPRVDLRTGAPPHAIRATSSGAIVAVVVGLVSTLVTSAWLLGFDWNAQTSKGPLAWSLPYFLLAWMASVAVLAFGFYRFWQDRRLARIADSRSPSREPSRRAPES